MAIGRRLNCEWLKNVQADRGTENFSPDETIFTPIGPEKLKLLNYCNIFKRDKKSTLWVAVKMHKKCQRLNAS